MLLGLLTAQQEDYLISRTITGQEMGVIIHNPLLPEAAADSINNAEMAREYAVFLTHADDVKFTTTAKATTRNNINKIEEMNGGVRFSV